MMSESGYPVPSHIGFNLMYFEETRGLSGSLRNMSEQRRQGFQKAQNIRQETEFAQLENW
jgi:hypothetical protein